MHCCLYSFLHSVINKSVVLHRLDCLDVANLSLEVLQLLLRSSVLLSHLLVLSLPLVTFGFEGLDFAFEVAGLDIGLAEPISQVLAGAKVKSCQYHLLVVRLT